MNMNLGDIGPEGNAHVLNYLHNDILGGRGTDGEGEGGLIKTRP